MIPVFFGINFHACAFFRESGATILNYNLFVPNVIYDFPEVYVLSW